MTPALGLYLHIPFCRQRCDFCAFYLELHREPAAEAFCRALETEIALLRPNHVSKAVSSRLSTSAVELQRS